MQFIIAAAMGLVVSLAGASAAQTSATALPSGARYVAMGSSYAAGPGISEAADGDTRCARSTNNYAHQFARKRELTLVDVSCSGATTRDILTASGTAPAQIDAVTPDTSLVTVTIGGNDVGFVTLLGSASCRRLDVGKQAPGGECPPAPSVTERTWQDLATSMRRIADEVHARAPAARLVFVDYPMVLPHTGRCAATPMSAAEADAARARAARLAALTATIARSAGATLLPASSLSRGHDACSAAPWIHGFPRPGQTRFVPYHPNRERDDRDCRGARKDRGLNDPPMCGGKSVQRWRRRSASLCLGSREHQQEAAARLAGIPTHSRCILPYPGGAPPS